jgi:hypothetical protein
MTDAVTGAASQHDAPSVSSLPTQSAAEALLGDDAAFAAGPPRRRLPALTKILVLAIIGTLAFGGGVLVQKQHDATLTAASRVPDFASLIGGGGGLPTGPSAAGVGTGSTAGASAGDAPVLVGTVESVSGSDLGVKDLGGTLHVVHATATTTLSIVGADWSGSLKPGATVSIQGTKAADGSVTATVVTQR